MAKIAIKARKPKAVSREARRQIAKWVDAYFAESPLKPLYPFPSGSRNPGANWNVDGWDLLNRTFWLNYDDPYIELRTKWVNSTGHCCHIEVREK